MPGRCSLSSSCSTGVMPCEASVDTSPVLKCAAPNSWRLWTYDAQVWMPGVAANSACGSRKVGISTDGRTPETVWKGRKGQARKSLAPMRRLSIRFVDQSLCLLEIRSIETLSEPGINRLKQIYVVRAPKSQAHPLYPAATKPRIWLSSGSCSRHWQNDECPLLADIVAKVEIEPTLKISRKLIFGLLCCCVAFQRSPRRSVIDFG